LELSGAPGLHWLGKINKHDSGSSTPLHARLNRGVVVVVDVSVVVDVLVTLVVVVDVTVVVVDDVIEVVVELVIDVVVVDETVVVLVLVMLVVVLDVTVVVVDVVIVVVDEVGHWPQFTGHMFARLVLQSDRGADGQPVHSSA
jgi:hypothetical protein